MAKKKKETAERHDDWNSPAHKDALRAGEKYGNDVALWPKELAEREYSTRKRLTAEGPTLSRKKTKKKATKKQAARKRA